jgi:hypothetical protein
MFSAATLIDNVESLSLSLSLSPHLPNKQHALVNFILFDDLYTSPTVTVSCSDATKISAIIESSRTSLL